MKKNILKIGTAVLVLTLMFGFNENANELKIGKGYYCFITCWSNGEYTPEGLAYITNVFYIREDYSSSLIEGQFNEVFLARYGKRLYNIYPMKSMISVFFLDTENEAINKRNKQISKYKMSDTKVRYMSRFQFHWDD